MKKFFRLFGHILILPVLVYLYGLAQILFLADLLGCGCPVVSPDGITTTRRFDANDFTLYFWIAVFIASIILSVLNLKQITKPRNKIFYIATVTILAFIFCSLPIALYRLK